MSKTNTCEVESQPPRRPIKKPVPLYRHAAIRPWPALRPGAAPPARRLGRGSGAACSPFRRPNVLSGSQARPARAWPVRCTHNRPASRSSVDFTNESLSSRLGQRCSHAREVDTSTHHRDVRHKPVAPRPVYLASSVGRLCLHFSIFPTSPLQAASVTDLRCI